MQLLTVSLPVGCYHLCPPFLPFSTTRPRSWCSFNSLEVEGLIVPFVAVKAVPWPTSDGPMLQANTMGVKNDTCHDGPTWWLSGGPVCATRQLMDGTDRCWMALTAIRLAPVSLKPSYRAIMKVYCAGSRHALKGAQPMSKAARCGGFCDKHTNCPWWDSILASHILWPGKTNKNVQPFFVCL